MYNYHRGSERYPRAISVSSILFKESSLTYWFFCLRSSNRAELLPFKEKVMGSNPIEGTSEFLKVFSVGHSLKKVQMQVAHHGECSSPPSWLKWVRLPSPALSSSNGMRYFELGVQHLSSNKSRGFETAC